VGRTNSLPFVSVLVPTYNGEKYLSACLESVLAQVYQDWELIIVDDCSTDATAEIAQAYARRDSRVRVERNPFTLGLVGNWNRCATLARGAWVKFVFQDDLIVPTCIEEMLGARHVDTAFVACRREFLFEEGTTNAERQFYGQHASLTELGGMSEVSPEVICQKAIDLLGVNFIGEPSSVLLRRDVFDRFGPFNPHFIMICDTEYWIRVASHTGLTYVSKTLCQFRVHGGSASARHFASRRYRITLDSVLLVCEYAFGERYAALREVGSQRVPPVDFVELLRRKATKARRMAVERAERRNDSIALMDWERFIRAHPRIEAVLSASESSDSSFLTRLSQGVRNKARKIARRSP
jgi:glycosyltransferase involved in cell wall biosynthesis